MNGYRARHRRLPLATMAALAAAVLAACSSGSSGASSTAGSAAPAASTVAASSAPSTSTVSAPQELRIGYQAIPNGDLVVKNQKLLEKALPDSTIKWVQFDSGGDVNTAIVAGSIDIGLAGSSPVTKGLSAPLNIPYSVPWIHDVIGDAESLVVRNSSGVTDVKGLVGKKIATPFVSTSHYSLLAALKLAGVAPSKVKLIDLQPPDILAAWKRGDIDAAYVWSPTLDELKKDGSVLTTSTEVSKAGYPTYDLAVVTNKLRTTYPDVVAAWTKAQNEAVTALQADDPGAIASIAAELNLSNAEVESQIKGLTFLTAKEQQSSEFLGTTAAPGKFAASLQSAAEFLKTQGAIDAVPELSTLQAGIDTDAVAGVGGS
jgi:taurine transport system substrate-binding protein